MRVFTCDAHDGFAVVYTTIGDCPVCKLEDELEKAVAESIREYIDNGTLVICQRKGGTLYPVGRG